MTDIARRFEGLHPADLRGGVSDIAMVSRELVGNERELFALALCRGMARQSSLKTENICCRARSFW